MKPLPRVTELNAPYFEAARRGALRIQQCRSCRQYVFYPRAWCPVCRDTGLDWVDVSGRGLVVTFSTVRQAPSPAFAADLPYVLAVIELAEGPQMMANIVGMAPELVHVGLPVRVVFEQRGDVWIPQFEPDGGSNR
jgi:uncharacterized OB-fold protein